MSIWGDTYTDPSFTGWRGILARNARKQAAAAARVRRANAVAWRLMVVRNAEALASRQGKKR